MLETVDAAKQRLRREMLQRRRALSPAAVAAGSDRIAGCLQTWPPYLAATTVMFYLAMPDEPQTDLMINDAIQRGKQVCVPLLTPKYGEMTAARIESLADLVTGRLGLRMPDPASARMIEPADIDLVVVPGVAFDAAGNRLGMGAGYYDRFLVENRHGTYLGLAWSFQLTEKLPSDEHDISMHYLLTEGGFLSCGAGQG
ncbi:MAG: 5-formyltetrahydrofolate cyclo-ligase [Negativicutes bacterium]|nr:5-formyltetrahydrofolate cyclo-ligase [Negativicutes bacterium]